MDPRILFDEEDAHLVKDKIWLIHSTGYVYTKQNGENIFLHKLILSDLTKLVDHKNRNRLDNRRDNLRYATRSQNCINRLSTSKSGYRGVYLVQGRWVAEIKYEKQRKFLGGFTTKEKAAIAYNVAAIKYHGEFAILNEV